MDRPLILTADRNSRNLELLSNFLSREGFATLPANTLEQFDAALASPQAIRAALVDISGFDGAVWLRCEQLRKLNVPFLILSSRQTAALQQASISRGARGVMVKPLAARELIALVRTMAEDE